jgi:hypothetical protein
MKPESLGLWCGYCKHIVNAWTNESVGMCAECVAKCSSCGGTGLLPLHPRLGLSTFCACDFGKAKARETP